MFSQANSNKKVIITKTKTKFRRLMTKLDIKRAREDLGRKLGHLAQPS